MRSADSRLVDLVRDFLIADRLLRRIFARHARGELKFEEVQELVGDGEGSVLFRLKEHCHALFRSNMRGAGVAMRREALFDLAVGSLFHEAMKLRENLYQRTVYAPKVRALRSEAEPEAAEIFREFEKILAAAAVRLDEACLETEALLQQTRAQFRRLLAVHRGNGLVARYLIENAALVDEVFEEGLAGLLDHVHGNVAAGYLLAARSYLRSGYFAEARGALAETAARGGAAPDVGRLRAYAEGMDAYLAGRHRDALAHLTAWEAAGAGGEEDQSFTPLAHAAALRIAHLTPEGEPEQEEAIRLAKRIEPALGAAASHSGAAPTR
jgi:hypothetical protein